MRILIIRHAEPDYEHDSLTEKGEREAALLAERLCRIPITACYIWDTLAFFCHFGLKCVLLSHLLDISPMVLWHHTCALASSVTSLYTEEPSFAARFCETWDNEEERHD